MPAHLTFEAILKVSYLSTANGVRVVHVGAGGLSISPSGLICYARSRSRSRQDSRPETNFGLNLDKRRMTGAERGNAGRMDRKRQ